MEYPETQGEACPLREEADRECFPECANYWKAYEACGERLQDPKNAGKDCSGTYFDYIECLDKCAVPKFFKKLN